MAPFYMRMLGLAQLDDYLKERLVNGANGGRIPCGRNGKYIEQRPGRNGVPRGYVVRPNGQRHGNQRDVYSSPRDPGRPRSAEDFRMFEQLGSPNPPGNVVGTPPEQNPVRRHHDTSRDILNENLYEPTRDMRQDQRSRSVDFSTTARHRYSTKFGDIHIHNSTDGNQRQSTTPTSAHPDYQLRGPMSITYLTPNVHRRSHQSSYASSSEASPQPSVRRGRGRHRDGHSQRYSSCGTSSNTSSHSSPTIAEPSSIPQRRRPRIRSVSPSVASTRTFKSDSSQSTPSTAATSVSGNEYYLDHRFKVPGSFPSEQSGRARHHERDYHADRRYHKARDYRRPRSRSSFEEGYTAGPKRAGREQLYAPPPSLESLRRAQRRQQLGVGY